MSIFTPDDREEWRRRSEGTPEEQAYARSIAPKIVEDLKEDARQKFRTYGSVSSAGADVEANGRFISEGALVAAVRSLIPGVFEIPEGSFKVTYTLLYYPDEGLDSRSVAVTFNPPLT